jgi:putative MATE family efflux protein
MTNKLPLLTRDKDFYKSFLAIFPFLVFQSMLMLSINLADQIMIGMYDQYALSGVIAVNKIMFVFMQIMIGAGETIVVLGSQYCGEGRKENIRKFTFPAFVTAMSLGLIFFTATALFPEFLIGIFTPDEKIIAEGVKYLSIVKMNFLVLPVSTVLYSTFRSAGGVKASFYLAIVALFVSVSINSALIFGSLGAPELGVTGAAIGNVTARSLETILLLIFAFKKEKVVRLTLGNVIHFDKRFFKDYLRQAWFFIMVGLLFGIFTALHTITLGQMQSSYDNVIAADGAATTLFQFLKTVSMAAAGTSAILIGKAVGVGDVDKIKEYTRTLQTIFLCIGAFTAITLFAARVPYLRLYNIDAETRELASSFMLILCIASMGMAYQMPVLAGIVRGGGDSKFMLYNDLITIWGIVVPLSLLGAFVFHWHPVAVMCCLHGDQIIKCGAAVIKCNRYRWMKKLTR